MPASLLTLVKSMRPNFLVLPLVVMVLVMATASYDGFRWSGYLMWMITLAAVAAHISVNLFNEAEDAASGLDDLTDKTPFSGGSGALQAYPQYWPWVAGFGYFFLGTVLVLGLFLIYLRGLAILYLGLLGVVLIVGYSRHITRMPWLSLISPGLAFGPIMLIGGYFALTGSASLTVLGLSLLVFLLVNNLLLLNQFPDAEADKSVGRLNWVIAQGKLASAQLFGVNLLLVYGLLAGLIGLQILPVQAALGFVTLFLAWPLQVGVKKHYNELQQKPSLLALNVAVVLLTPALIAMGLFLATV